MRNNTNYSETAALTALQLVSSNPSIIIDNFYRKSLNAIEEGTRTAPHGFIIPSKQRDMTRVETLLNLLLVQGIEVPQGRLVSDDGATASGTELLLLSGCAVAGYTLGRLMRLPGYQIIGPMAAAASLYMAGIVNAPLPPALIAMAPVVIGASIGVRFQGLNLLRMAWPLLFALISGAMMLTAAIVLSELAAPWIGVSNHALLLARAQRRAQSPAPWGPQWRER